jgi:gamma-glutamylcyclotransferase (GGCT)/AIG2-like uncharacterized protein YtfP
VYDGYSNSRNGAAANIVHSEKDIVWGGLFEINDEDLAKLDRCKGYPISYNRKKVDVKDEDGNSYNSIVYFREGEKIGKPHQDYRDILLKGAKDCDLPVDYVKDFLKKVLPFRALDSGFLKELMKGKLRFILEFERKHKKSFMVEIRNNFLDLYFLGHGIEVKRRYARYYLMASNKFNPKSRLPDKLKKVVKEYDHNKWQISFDDLKRKHYKSFEEIMTSIILKIVEHSKGNISEGVSEINHFIDNRTMEKNGILIIDRQVVYPRSKKGRIDLLGLKRLNNGKFTFVVLELKNKNNTDIANVFTNQVKRYVDLVYDKYEDFRLTYKRVLKQKIKLGLLEQIECNIASKKEISKRDIEGIVVLDNYDIKSDLKDDGLLNRALKDWASLGDEYNAKLFLKTNVLDSTFFMDYRKAANLLNKFKRSN